MSANVNISKDGFQMPYRQFLEDGAIGLVAILVTVVCYHTTLLTPTALRDILGRTASLGTETKVFVGVLLFLLAPPVGFVVNALSWILLDRAVGAVSRDCFCAAESDKAIFPIWDISKTRYALEIAGKFGLTKDSFDSAAWMFRDLIDSYAASRFESQAHIEGLIIFLRNIGLLSGTMMILSLTNIAAAPLKWIPLGLLVGCGIDLLIARHKWVDIAGKIKLIAVSAIGFGSAVWLSWGTNFSRWIYQSIVFLVLTTLCILVAGMVEYYYHLTIIFHAYLICHEYAVRLPAQPTELLRVAESLASKAGERGKPA